MLFRNGWNARCIESKGLSVATKGDLPCALPPIADIRGGGLHKSTGEQSLCDALNIEIGRL